MKDKKIPRAIKKSLIEKLAKISPDINEAIEKLINANLRESHAESAKDSRQNYKKDAQHQSTAYPEPQTSRPGFEAPRPIGAHVSTQMSTDIRKLAKQIWPHIQVDIETMIDQAIDEAKRGYR